jgi:hypothetical protein
VKKLGEGVYFLLVVKSHEVVAESPHFAVSLLYVFFFEPWKFGILEFCLAAQLLKLS